MDINEPPYHQRTLEIGLGWFVAIGGRWRYWILTGYAIRFRGSISRMLLWCLAYISAWSSLVAQPVTFERISAENGLSSDRINALVQDSSGFLWIGTASGLNRYDGRSFTKWFHDGTDTTSLSSHNILSLHSGSAGEVWVGTDDGLNCYDPQNGNFRRYLNQPDTNIIGTHQILCIAIDHRQNIWCGTYNGIYLLKPKTGTTPYAIQTIQHHKNEKTSLADNLVWTIFEDHQKNIWVGTKKGLDLYEGDLDRDLHRFRHFKNNPADTRSISHNRVWNIQETTDGTLWVGTASGLNYFNREKGNILFRKYLYDESANRKNNYGQIYALHVNPQQDLWIGTHQHGLYRARFETGNDLTFQQFTSHAMIDNSLSGNIIKEIMTDEAGILWVGTNNGLNKYDPNANRFIHHLKPETGSTSYKVRAICTDRFGYTWIGLNGGGLFRVKIGNDQEIIGKPDVFTEKNSGLSSNGVFSLLADSKGYLWIGTYKGLNRIQLNSFDQTGKWDTYLPGNSANSLVSRYIFTLLEDSYGFIWAGTYGGLSRIRVSPKGSLRFRNFTSQAGDLSRLINSTTYCMVEDQWQNLWIGTFGGLSKYSYSPEADTFAFTSFYQQKGSPNSLRNNRIFDLHRDNRDRIWVATSTGLDEIVINEEKPGKIRFRHHRLSKKQEGLSISSILEDGIGRLWLGTNQGIYRYLPDCRGGEGQINTCIKVFDKSDGLQSDVFKRGARFKSLSGHLYFGGTNGFNIIDPQLAYSDTYEPPVVFTAFRLFNEPVKAGMPTKLGRTVLQHPVDRTKKLRLTYHDNVFSFEFAALGFSKPHKVQYAYRMDPFDKDWIYTGNLAQATYTNLDPGQYTFSVKATNSSGTWSAKTAQMEIEILPPPWATWWAYSFYSLAAAGFIISIIWLRERRQKQQLLAAAKIEKARHEEREQIRKKNAADFHDELGHKLTKINLFAEMASRQTDPDLQLKAYLAKIKSNTAALSEGMRDFIWVLDPEKDSLENTLMRLKEFGDQLFELTAVNYRVTGLSGRFQQIQLDLDKRKQVLLIFKEAMNNCLKYAKCSTATLSAEVSGETLHIVFNDDGKGFDPNRPTQGYGVKNMQERAKKINATLHLNSEPGTGTAVELSLTIPHLH